MDTSIRDAIRDGMSPAAVALIVATLADAQCTDKSAQAEVEWLRDELTDMLGGEQALSGLCEEIGV